MEGMTTGGASELAFKGETSGGVAGTQTLLRMGMVGGPFYLVLGLAQALVRDGFDLLRHPLSVLANGPGGWVQTANFLLAGLMVIAAAVGFRRVLGTQSPATAWFLGGFGLSMVLAAFLPADPVDGFPPGTPVGPPTTISTTGMLHFLIGTLGFVSLAISCFAASRAMKRRDEPSLARLSLLSGIGVLVGFFGGAALAMTPVGTLGIWFSVVVGWAWIWVMARRLCA